MLICDNGDCECVFDCEDEAAVRYEEETGEKFITCPACGGEDHSAASECEGCGEHFRTKDLEDGLCIECRPEVVACAKCKQEVHSDDTNEGLCASCQRKAARLLQTVFTVQELAYIRSLFEAERLSA